VDYAPLSGGVGDLTNGYITDLNWRQAENEAGTGPYVGWRATHLRNPSIVFHFDSAFLFDRVHIHTDDSNGDGGVVPPGSVTVTDDAQHSASYGVANPAAATPFWIGLDLTGKGLRGYTLTVQFFHAGGWVMIDEVEFFGDRVATPPSFAAGVFDPGAARWYLRTSFSPGAPDIDPFVYGAPGWTPLAGDWNGDGRTTIGVVDPATETWYLRNSNSPGGPDVPAFQFGAPGWIPVAGDWDGNGTITAGVFNANSGTWYLKNSNTPGAPDVTPFAFGGPGWTPVVGDWNGDGTTTVGVFDPAGRWYLRNSNAAGAPDLAPFAYGGPGWRPVSGDWNGDRTRTVGVFDPAGRWYLHNTNAAGAPDVTPFAFGAGSWKPLVGDWNASASLSAPVAGSTGLAPAPASASSTATAVGPGDGLSPALVPLPAAGLGTSEGGSTILATGLGRNAERSFVPDQLLLSSPSVPKPVDLSASAQTHVRAADSPPLPEFAVIGSRHLQDLDDLFAQGD
jgi:hypothetical protein